MNDLINRQEVIKRIQGTGYAEQIKDNVIFILRMVPSEAEQHWISCSERLPDEKDCPMDCMVTRYSKQIGAYVDMAVCERDGTWTHEDWDAIVLGDVESGRKTGLMNTHDHPILAWMPLPTPYKGGDDE